MSEENNNSNVVLKIQKDDSVIEHLNDQKALKDFDQYLHHFRLSKHNKEKKIIDIQNHVSINSGSSSGQNHMIKRIHTRDESVRYYDSDSPITMYSSDGEPFGEEHDFETSSYHPNFIKDDFLEENFSKKETSPHTHSHEKDKKKYKKLSYEKVKNSLDTLNNSEKYSSEIDILITFLKGQAHLYSLSKYLTQQKINWLTIPSFIFSIVVTILSPLIHDYVWSGILISALTAFITSAFGCVRFYELDASVTTYLNLTNQYNRMQTSLEMMSNSIVLNVSQENDYKNRNERMIVDKIREIEQKITEIKENNTFLPPEEVKFLIPIISNINIFTFIKKIELLKKNFIFKYKEIKNEMRFILNKWEKNDKKTEIGDDIISHDTFDRSEKVLEKETWKEEESRMNRKYVWKLKQKEYKREKKRMSYLYKQKTLIRKELIYYMTAYTYIDELFTREITRANIINNSCFFWSFYRYFFDTYEYISCDNPVVDNYLHFIFMNHNRSSRKNSIEKVFEDEHAGYLGDMDNEVDFEHEMNHSICGDENI